MSDVRMAAPSTREDGEAAGCPVDRWRDGKCFLTEDWAAIAASGLQGALEFNNRNGRYAPLLAQEPFVSCDKQLAVTVRDSGSVGKSSTKALLDVYHGSRECVAQSTTAAGSGSANATAASSVRRYGADIVVGPARSAACSQAAIPAGIYNVPMISYWATSAKLDDATNYPRFMRTIPTDDGVAKALVGYVTFLDLTY